MRVFICLESTSASELVKSGQKLKTKYQNIKVNNKKILQYQNIKVNNKKKKSCVCLECVIFSILVRAKVMTEEVKIRASRTLPTLL